MEKWKRYDAYNKCIADFGGHSLPMGLHLSNPASGFDAGEGIGETAWQALRAKYQMRPAESTVAWCNHQSSSSSECTHNL